MEGNDIDAVIRTFFWSQGKMVARGDFVNVFLPLVLLFPPLLFVLPGPENLSCVRASANHLVITAAAASSLLFPLPFPCIDSSSASAILHGSEWFFYLVARQSQDALLHPRGDPCNPQQKQAARRGGCNQGGAAVARNCKIGGFEDDRQHNDRLGGDMTAGLSVPPTVPKGRRLLPRGNEDGCGNSC